MNSPAPVVIIGGGWAGLSTAIELSHNKIPVTLIESNQQLGGRGRTITIDNMEIDNGQHLLIGAYTETLRLLKLMGHQESDLFDRQPTLLYRRTYTLPGFRLSLPRIAAPLHFLLGLLTAKGFSLKERITIIQLCLTLNRCDFSIAQDLPLLQWLEQNNQTAKIITQFWQPLCLAILNTPISIASSEVFLLVLKDSFTLKRNYSDFLFSRHNIGRLFPEPAQHYLEKTGATLITTERVKSIEQTNQDQFTLHLHDYSIAAQHVVLAVPPKQCHRLTENLSLLTPLHQQLKRFKTSPITTVYLRYAKNVSLDQDMVGVSGGILEWLIDRSGSEQAGIIAGIISGPGPHMALSKEALAQKVVEEIRTLFPHWPEPLHISVVREKQATFLCESGVNSYRPENNTAVPHLWLAGDYTNTGYPSTLEGAVRSGVACAKKILHNIR
ncbi:MAG: hypothetical protein COC09_06165 [Gammaproteobacteria bacterium]|nr:MAG: hypothetical protein COC09_06165 [Gammaproteobacteria bacterium]